MAEHEHARAIEALRWLQWPRGADVVAEMRAAADALEGLPALRATLDAVREQRDRYGDERDDLMAEAERLRALLSDLRDAATSSANISTWDGWHTHAPRVELPAELEQRVRAALDEAEPPAEPRADGGEPCE